MEVRAAKRTMPTQWVLYEEPPRNLGIAYPVVETPYQQLDGRVYRSESWVIICPKCGVVWARRYALDSPDIDNWHSKMVPCRTHGHGSLWQGWDEPWTRSLPYLLLVREMDILQRFKEAGVRDHIQHWKYKHYGEL